MISIFRKSFYKNGYLLIIAAWLFTISFIISNYLVYSSSSARVKRHIESYLKSNEARFEVLSADTVLVKQLINRTQYPQNVQNYFNEEDIGLFVYQRNSDGSLVPLFWNTNRMSPKAGDLNLADGKYLSKHENGYFEFIKKTYHFGQKEYVSSAIIPIYWNYFIDNKYLQNSFAALQDIEKQYKPVITAADIYIKNGDGKTLFDLVEKKQILEYPGALPITLRLLAVIFILVFINVFCFEVVKEQGWWKGFGLLAGSLLILRTLTYFFPFPFRYRNLALFDSGIYASSTVHPSLGDLLINVVLLFWMISFIKFAAVNRFKNFSKITGNKGWWPATILSFVLVGLALSSAGIIRTLINDSKIPFDVSNFSGLNIYTLLSFIILCFIILSFFHISHIVLLFIYKSTSVTLERRFLLVAIVGLFCLTFWVDTPSTAGNVFVLIWLLVYMSIMEFRKEDIFIPILRSSFFVVWIIFFAASVSALIVYQYRDTEVQQSKSEAERLALIADPNEQYIFNSGIAGIDSAFLTDNVDRLNDPVTNKAIKDSLSKQYFSYSYLRFDTKLYTFDENHMPLANEDLTTSYDKLNDIAANRSRTTEYPDLHYYIQDINGFSYIYFKKIFDKQGRTRGHLFIVANPKEYKGLATYPELFNHSADGSDYDITYATYIRENLIKSNGDYNFSSRIPMSSYQKGEFVSYVKGETKELWYNAGGNKLIVTVSEGSLSLQFITLFAYLFGSFLFVVVFFQVGDILIKYKFSIKSLRNSLKFNIKNQIQAAIIFISVFSFLIIGIATISFYIQRFDESNGNRLVRATKILAAEIEVQIADHKVNVSEASGSEVGNQKLQQTIKDISEIHNVDANLYSLEGRMLATTQPDIYNREVLSKLMEPNAYKKLHYRKETQLIQNESVSHLRFVSVYVPVNNEFGMPYAYLNIPYLNTQKELNQEISNFLVTLINLNAFIFVIAGAISVFLTNRITNSFSLIAGKMKEVNLGKANEKIVWNTNDEIGMLINEYNKMVKKLEASAVALATSEREGAWREMARQVAHEIKNPLTPMKLSIQYLQKSIQEKNANTVELSKKVTATLVEQIDQLAKIASDFSQFANIGNVKNEVFDVKEILNSLINLYSSNERLNINYNAPQPPVLIKADRTQINRLFTNLFQNAIEASDNNPSIEVAIDVAIDANQVKIDFKDHGSGISIEKQDKIFTPNFTTKSSGTGLGLAISKGIVENANGRIWFDTEENKGTTFHVVLPLSS